MWLKFKGDCKFICVFSNISCIWCIVAGLTGNVKHGAFLQINAVLKQMFQYIIGTSSLARIITVL